MNIVNNVDIKKKTVRINGFQFDIIPKKSCRRFSFAGDIDFHTRKKDSIDSVTINGEEVFVAENGKGNGSFIGCIEVENGLYLRILDKKTSPLVFIIPICAAALIAVLFIPKLNPVQPEPGTPSSSIFEMIKGKVETGLADDDSIDIDPWDVPGGFTIDPDADDWDGELPVSGEKVEASAESIIIPGYADIFLNEKTTSVQLINPDKNTVYMVYTLINDGKEVFKTDGIGPGKQITVNLYELLSKGEYDMEFNIATFDVETLSPCNGAKQSVKVTVK